MMGYYTRYSLTFDAPTPKQRDEVINALNAGVPCGSYGDFWLRDLWAKPSALESVKWYVHEVDVREFSKRFPTVVFSLSGEGEEPGDIWRKYFKNGKMQVARAQITFAPFDERELE